MPYLCIVFRYLKCFKDSKSSLNMTKIDKKLPEIWVRQGEKKKLCELLNTSYVTVIAALRGDYVSDFVLRIRKLALERGGREV